VSHAIDAGSLCPTEGKPAAKPLTTRPFPKLRNLSASCFRLARNISKARHDILIWAGEISKSRCTLSHQHYNRRLEYDPQIKENRPSSNVLKIDSKHFAKTDLTACRDLIQARDTG